MPAENMDIPQVTGSTPAIQAARVLLRDRLRDVEKLIQRCRHEQPPTSEAVHQLRASTRKADVALVVFKGQVHAKARKQLRKRLRGIRAAAGGVRDTDVALEILRELASQAEALPGLAETINGAEFRRAEQIKTLEAGVSRSDERRIRKLRRRLTRRDGAAASTDQSTLPFRDLAQPVLAKAIHRVRIAAARDLSDIATLHRLRMAVRRLRFSLELLEACVPGASRYAEALHDVTHLLGRVNDLARVAAMCEEIVQAGPDAAMPPIGRALSARFALIRDRRHAHALQFVATLDPGILSPLESCMSAAAGEPGRVSIPSPPWEAGRSASA